MLYRYILCTLALAFLTHAQDELLSARGRGFGGCPALGANLDETRDGCEWIVMRDSNGCPRWFLSCEDRRRCPNNNEIWFQCTSNCEASCSDPMPTCNSACGRSGCQCAPDFFRDSRDRCVPVEQCTCPNGEEILDGTTSFCEPTCANPNPTCVSSARIQALPQCVCRQGLVRDQNSGRCVRFSQCAQPNGCSRDDDCIGTSIICEDRQCVQGCISSNSCSFNAVCANGRCIGQPPRPPPTNPNSCRRDRDCSFGRICQQGRCIFDDACSRDSQCAGNSVCEDGSCVDGCSSDRQCDRGSRCRNGRCVFVNPSTCRNDFECPGSRVCERGRCTSGCNSNRDCRRGQRCSRSHCVFSRSNDGSDSNDSSE